MLVCCYYVPRCLVPAVTCASPEVCPRCQNTKLVRSNDITVSSVHVSRFSIWEEKSSWHCMLTTIHFFSSLSRTKEGGKMVSRRWQGGVNKGSTVEKGVQST